MKSPNSCYCSNYGFALKLFLAAVLSFFLVCCARNDAQQVLPENGGKLSSENPININTATLDELQKLPFIGTKSAERIVEYRNKYGKFRRVEHLLLIQGISDEKFRRIKAMIKVE